jgi:hypothetical protein
LKNHIILERYFKEICKEMNYEIKEMLENKTVFKIVWIFIFAIILGFVRVVYNEIKTPYAIFRSLFLSVCAALIV